jgi:hypothetical protein
MEDTTKELEEIRSKEPNGNFRAKNVPEKFKMQWICLIAD